MSSDQSSNSIHPLTLATACAVMMATACVATAHEASPERQARADVRQTVSLDQEEVVRRIQAYCRASWKNSHIDLSNWDDCTQEVFARIFSTLTTDQMTVAITERESDERRELNRAIWAIAQRQRRQPKAHELSTQDDVQAADQDSWEEVHSELQLVLSTLENPSLRLSPTQKAIIRSVSAGASVPEIASHLNISTVRVSDEKYKATMKLQKYFASDRSDAALV